MRSSWASKKSATISAVCSAELPPDPRRDSGQRPHPRPLPVIIGQRRYRQGLRRLELRPLVQGQVEQLDVLLEVRELAERLGIEIARLGPDLAAFARDLDADLVIFAVGGRGNRIAEDIVGPGDGGDLVEVLLVEDDVRVVLAARFLRHLLQGVHPGRLVVPVEAVVAEQGIAAGRGGHLVHVKKRRDLGRLPRVEAEE